MLQTDYIGCTFSILVETIFMSVELALLDLLLVALNQARRLKFAPVGVKSYGQNDV